MIEELREWLTNNHAESESVWLVTFKKGKSSNYISYGEIVDELLCFGWIDSLPRKLDDSRTMLRISPRSSSSNWSGLNKKRVEKLKKQNRLQPAGIRAIELAMQSGTWNFLDDVEKGIIPSDLKSELNKIPAAALNFDRFPVSSKRAILEWIHSAKKPETREKRIRETVAKAAENKKANHPTGRDNGPS